jgi:dienelactone hydrolase
MAMAFVRAPRWFVIAPLALSACGGSSAAPGSDAGASDGGEPCAFTDAGAICRGTVVNLSDDAESRTVYWAAPPTPAPSNGRPAAILYQGTGFGPSLTWNVEVPSSAPFGGYYQLRVIDSLIEQGFTVIQPSAQGGTAWSTNNLLYPNYDTSPDGLFIPRLLAAIDQGTFGPIDKTRLYATGISSGGYMTSRMAVSYRGQFRALAIESGSYATCLGPICTIPALPPDHPPTLFLHGGADTIVPIGTARSYYDALVDAGIETSFVEDPDAGHQWLSSAPADIADWFARH